MLTDDRCHDAPAMVAAIASTRPGWSSEITNWVPDSPLAIRERRKASQPAPSSQACPTALQPGQELGKDTLVGLRIQVPGFEVEGGINPVIGDQVGEHLGEGVACLDRNDVVIGAVEEQDWDRELVRPIDPDNFAHYFHRLCDRAGLGHWTPHELRHSAASIMLAQGTPLYVVSEVLGHASVAITKDVYGHLIGAEKQEATEAITDVLFRNPQRTDDRNRDHGA